MSSFSGNAIIAKAKALYGHGLKESDYKELSRKKNVAEVAGYLKNQDNYRDVLQDIQEMTIHRGQLEELIKKNQFNQILRIIKFVLGPDKPFYEPNLIERGEIDLILATVRSIISGGFQIAIAEFPIYFVRHAKFDILSLSSVRTYADLLGAVRGTRYESILEPFATNDPEQIRYVEIERALETSYYDTIFERIRTLFKGKTRKELETMFMTKIELENIVKIYRLKKFYQVDPSVIRANLNTHATRISKKKLEEMIQLPEADMLLNYLSKSEFSKYMDEDEYVYIEYYADKMKYYLAKRYMHYSLSAPQVFYAFLILTEIERQNLFNIIEGIRYGLSNQEIDRMLIT
ncbi:MAG: V-type ATPase subunit [Candidatus Izemoplasmatales bacterium]